jgi:DNA-binding transcriptional MerR regulator
MTERPDARWTIDDLGAQVALALAVDYNGPPNGRVRDVPDRRTIRYYTTLGLLDRPAEIRGRTAYYGRRHLLQLVAIKRLQARGLGLAEIQQKLYGLPDTALNQIAELPAHQESRSIADGSASPNKAAPEPRDSAFWSAPPAPVPAESPKTEDEATISMPETDVPLQGVRLGKGVTLLLEAARPLYEDDLSALRVAAAPLLKLLDKRRLIRARHERETP